MKILDKEIDFSLEDRVLNLYDMGHPKEKDYFLAILVIRDGKIINCFSLARNTKYVAEFLNYVGISKDSIDIKSKKGEIFSGLVWDEDGKFYSVYENLPKDKKYETGSFMLDKTYHEIPDFSNVHVKGDFYVSSKKLNSLKGAPSKVDGNFFCVLNNLESLEGAPEFVGGNFCCSFNRLTSLENGPKKVGGYYTCCYNPKLKSNKCSTKVGKKFLCDYGITNDIEKMDFYREANKKINKFYDCEYSNREVKHQFNFLKNFNFPEEAEVFDSYKGKVTMLLNAKVIDGEVYYTGLFKEEKDNER